MKKLLIILSLLTLTVHAQVKENYYWEGNLYKAQSTNHISKVITPLGDGLIQFDLITTGCVPGGGGGGHVDDCSLIFDKTHPGEVFRSQLNSKTALPNDNSLEYSFKFKDISESDGLGFGGPGITIFEIYPVYTPTRNNGPTHHIWYDPKTKAIQADVCFKRCGGHNVIPGQLSIMAPGWNTFVIQTNQTTKRDGYLRIIHNGKIIVDYKGQTSYPHSAGVEYWIGAYVCCSFTRKGEPNHSFLFKDVKASIGLGGYDDKLKIETQAEALASIEASNAFDGSYDFILNIVENDGSILQKGQGTLEINEGIVTVNKDSKFYESLRNNFYRSFMGKIDKNGDILATFIFAPCSSCGMYGKKQIPESIVFNGNIEKFELIGIHGPTSLEVVFDIFKEDSQQSVEDELAAFEAELAAELGQ
jgi:hypothetical protein